MCQWTQTTMVSQGGELPTRPGAKGQRFISQLSCDVSLAMHGRKSAHIWAFVWNWKPQRLWESSLLLVVCNTMMQNNLKCHLFSHNPSGFPVMKLLWQLSINKALVNTDEGCWTERCVNRESIFKQYFSFSRRQGSNFPLCFCHVIKG